LAFSAFDIGWCFMNCLFWVFGCWLLTAASADPLTKLQTVTIAGSLTNYLTAASVDPGINLVTAASAVPLTKLSMAIRADLHRYLFLVDCFVSLSDSCSLRSARIAFGPTRNVCVLTGDYSCDRRGGVNALLLREGWLMAGEQWLNGGSNAPKRGRSVSITY